MANALKELCDLMKDSGATVCFCTVCSHQPQYGHCYVCGCQNHVAEPEQHDETDVAKLKAGLAKMREIAVDLKRQLDELKRPKKRLPFCSFGVGDQIRMVKERALTLKCPSCGASPSEPCHDARMRTREHPHSRRNDYARSLWEFEGVLVDG